MRSARALYHLSYSSDDTMAARSSPPDPLRVSLQRLGLGRHESLLYAALIERSPQGASALARAAGLARSSVYTALASLTDRGLVGTTHEGGVKQFVAEGHAALLDALKKDEARAIERAKLAATLAPHFERARGEGGSRLPHVVHFEGQDGLSRVYLTMLRQAPRGAVMSILRDDFLWTEAWSFVRTREWRARVRSLRAERDVSTRLLVRRTPLEEEARRRYGSQRHLAQRYLPRGAALERFAIYVLGEIVAVMSTREPSLVGIQIADPSLAENFRALFELLWSVSRAPRQAR